MPDTRSVPLIKLSAMLPFILLASCQAESAAQPQDGKKEPEQAEASPAGRPKFDRATRAIAENAVREGLSMLSGRERDVVLRTISRNLRHAHRDLAIKAARGMADPSELHSFDPGPDELTVQIKEMLASQREDANICKALARRTNELRREEESLTDFEAQANTHCLPHGFGDIVPPPTAPFETLIAVADALPAGRTKAEILDLALYKSWNSPPLDRARIALARLRTLKPHLPSKEGQMVSKWLDNYKVDLIDGEPNAAIARVRGLVESDAIDARTEVAGLISDLIELGETDRAIQALALLPPSADCEEPSKGFGSLYFIALGTFRHSTNLARFLDRLPSSDSFHRICPNGLPHEMAANLEFKAGRLERALATAERTGDPGFAAAMRNNVAEEWLRRGEIDKVRPLILRAAERLPPFGSEDGLALRGAARARMDIIHDLARIGELERAKQLAMSFPGPGWRGVALSVIVGTAARDWAGPRWGGPETELTEVSPLH